MDACNRIIEMDLEEAGDAICRNKKRRLKMAILRVNQRKLKLVNCLSRVKYYNQARLPATLKDQDFIPSIPLHAIFVFLDAILIGLLQVEYQNKKESPFDAHKIHMQTFLTSICIYCSLIGINIYTKTCGDLRDQILNFALLFFGILSSASLLSILLPWQLLWLVLFIWGSIPIIIARRSLKNLAYRIREKITKLTCDFCDHKFNTVSIFKTKDSTIGSNNTTCGIAKLT